MSTETNRKGQFGPLYKGHEGQYSWLLHRITGVNSDGERGALGVALHPRWPREPWVYVYVSRAPAGGELRNQLLRLRIDPRLRAIPEISGNRLIVLVRLMRHGPDDRLHAINDDIPFELTLCA